MVIMLNIHNHLFEMLFLYNSVYLVYVLRSYKKSLISVTKLLQRRCVLRLLSSFNSKFLSNLIPPIFLFLMSSSRPLFSTSHFVPGTTKRHATVSAMNEHQRR
jgi:hypothetical protein